MTDWLDQIGLWACLWGIVSIMPTDVGKFSLKKDDIIPRGGIVSYANTEGVVITSTDGRITDFLLLTMVELQLFQVPALIST